MSVYKDTEAAHISITTVQSLLFILNIVGNSLVCVIILKDKNMRTTVNFLLVNLAVADMIVAIFLTPKYIFSHTFNHPEGKAGTVLCKLLTGANIAWIGAGASVFSLAALAVERYFAVVYPHKNKGKLSKRRLKVIISCSWIAGVIWIIPAYIFRKFNKKWTYCINTWPEEWIGKAYSMFCLVLVLFAVALMVTLYSRVVYSLWLKRQELNENNNSQQGVLKVRKRVTLMVIIVSVVFGVCWVTDRINYVMVHYAPSHAFLSLAGSNTMVLFNSAINPIVYALVNQRFREKLKKIMRCSCRREHPARESEKKEVYAISTHAPVIGENPRKQEGHDAIPMESRCNADGIPMESRFLEPPRETEICFEKSGVREMEGGIKLS